MALEETTSLSLHTRTQWRGDLGANFQTNQASLIIPIPRKEVIDGFGGGVGLTAYQDKALNGSVQSGGINLSISKNVKLSQKSQLTLGVQGGIIQKSIESASFRWTSQYNPFIGYDANIDPGVDNINAQITIPDMSAGVLYFYNYNEDFNDAKMDGYIGASVYHLNQANQAMVDGEKSALPMLYKVHGGLDLKVAETINVSPNVLAVMQNSFTQINVGTYVTYMFAPLVERWNPAYVLLGGWYRLNDSYIFSTGIGGTYYSLSFSYDLNASSLSDFSSGANAYEISLKLKKPAKKMRSFHTPRV